MDTFSGLLLGLDVVLNPGTLLYCFAGVFLGTLVGVLPGIGAMATISLLLPVTYHVPATTAIVMLAGVYYGAQYGGSTASILLNLPGTPSSAVTCLDGYPMAKQGRAGVALFITTMGSFVGSMLGILVLVLFTPAIAELGLRFGSAEYFAMMLLGLVAASALTAGSAAKGLGMVALGLLLGTVGTDINSGQPRFDFGVAELSDGLNLVALAMGVFGIAEVISSINRVHPSDVKEPINLRTLTPTRQDLKDSAWPILRGTGVGSFFGALPGTGAAIASFMAYAVEKRIAKDPGRFGNGAIEGIASPEAANMALMLGALIIHGVQPGPQLMSEQPALFWGLVVSFGIGNIMLVILNLPLIGIWVAILRIPYRMLYPPILVFICLGVYSVHNNSFDILLVAGLGVFGYLLSVFRFSPAPLLLGFVLGPLMEEHLRRALLLSRGDLMTFVDRPVSAGFLVLSAAVLLWGVFSSLKSVKTQVQ
jgi:putative tricarboxylic transport membrane protein